MGSALLTDDAVVELRPLHIGEACEGEHEVGRSDTGVFVSLPTPGVELITWLQAGLPLGEVRRRFAERHGQAPDLEDFVEGIASLGFVRRIGDNLVGDEASETRPSSGWNLLSELPARRVAWLLSRPMQAVYAAVWLAVPTLFILRPGLIPSADSAVFSDRVMINAAALTLVGWLLLGFHEFAHLLATRARGCASSLNINHRLHFLAAVTDMSSVRSLPRRQRYGPYLAGMTWDMAILLACSLMQLAGLPSPLPGVIAYMALMTILFQFGFFMRTDIYFVIANWLRLGNLMEDTQHWLLNQGSRLLGRQPPNDLSAIPQRELRVIRWYSVLWVLGVAVELGQFVLLGLPVLARLLAQAAANLGEGPARTPFWDGALFIAVVAANFGLLFYVMVRNRQSRHVAGA